MEQSTLYVFSHHEENETNVLELVIAGQFTDDPHEVKTFTLNPAISELQPEPTSVGFQINGDVELIPKYSPVVASSVFGFFCSSSPRMITNVLVNATKLRDIRVFGCDIGSIHFQRKLRLYSLHLRYCTGSGTAFEAISYGALILDLPFDENLGRSLPPPRWNLFLRGHNFAVLSTKTVSWLPLPHERQGLHIANVNINEETLLNILLVKVRVISLYGCKVFESSTSEFGRQLNSTVEELDLDIDYVSNEVLKQILSLVPNLNSVVLPAVSIGPDIFELMKMLGKLVVIDFSRCPDIAMPPGYVNETAEIIIAGGANMQSNLELSGAFPSAVIC